MKKARALASLVPCIDSTTVYRLDLLHLPMTLYHLSCS